MNWVPGHMTNETREVLGRSIIILDGEVQIFTKGGVKCDMCGSTTIDHTEAQCSQNQKMRRANTKPGRKLAPKRK